MRRCSGMDEREKQIIRLRFYEGRTQMEVASEIGISQAQVSRLEKNALKCMRELFLTGRSQRKDGTYSHFFRQSSSLTSTRMISLPIWTIHRHGITYSKSRPRNQHRRPGPGTMMASTRHPVRQSISQIRDTAKGTAGANIDDLLLPQCTQTDGLRLFTATAVHRIEFFTQGTALLSFTNLFCPL